MKRYIFGTLAVLFAVAMAAFTIPNKTHLSATHVFEFDGVSNAYTVGNVTTNANWKYVGEISQEPLCDDTPDKACRIAVTDAYVNSTSNPTALSGMAISATTSLSGNAYVTGITDEGANLFTNQEADN